MTYANVMATVAVFVALGGTSYAVATGSIDSREIKNNTVRSKDIRNNEIGSKDVRDRSLLAKDFEVGQLPAGSQGPRGETGPQGPPGVSGLEQVQAQSAGNSDSSKQVTATCPGAKQVIGSGAEIVGGTTGSPPNELADVVIQKLVPGEESGTGEVFVKAVEEEPTAAAWSVVAFALCASAS
jgi:hypothetical protein